MAAFLVMPLLSFYWKVHDAAVGLLATCSKIVSLVIISIAWNGWVLFLGSCAGFLSAFSSIVIRLATVTLGPRNLFVINDLKLARELFDRDVLSGRAHTDWLKLIKMSNGKMRADLCTLLS